MQPTFVVRALVWLTLFAWPSLALASDYRQLAHMMGVFYCMLALPPMIGILVKAYRSPGTGAQLAMWSWPLLIPFSAWCVMVRFEPRYDLIPWAVWGTAIFVSLVRSSHAFMPNDRAQPSPVTLDVAPANPAQSLPMSRPLFHLVLATLAVLLIFNIEYAYHFSSYFLHPPPAEWRAIVFWSGAGLAVRLGLVLVALRALLRRVEPRRQLLTLIACMGLLMLMKLQWFPVVRNALFGLQSSSGESPAFLYLQFFWLGFLLWRLTLSYRFHRGSGAAVGDAPAA